MNDEQQQAEFQEGVDTGSSEAAAPGSYEGSSTESANIAPAPVSNQVDYEIQHEAGFDRQQSVDAAEFAGLHNDKSNAGQPGSLEQVGYQGPLPYEGQNHPSSDQQFVGYDSNSDQNHDEPIQDDYLLQAQSAVSAIGSIDPKKTLIAGSVILLSLAVIGAATLFFFGTKKDEASGGQSSPEASQQEAPTAKYSTEDLTVKIPPNWRVVEDSEIGARVKLPDLDEFGTSGSSSSEQDGVELITSAYGVAVGENESSMSISLVRAKDLKDEKQLYKLVDQAGSASSPANLIYKDIKSTLTKKNVNNQPMYIHEFSGKFASKKMNNELFKSSTVYLFKEGLCFGVIGTTDPKKPDYVKELNYAYTVAATLEKL